MGRGQAIAWTVVLLAGCATTTTAVKPAPSRPVASPRAGSEASGRCRDLLPLIEKASGEIRVDAALLVGIVRTESNFRPEARSGMGAIGLTQVLGSTGRAKKCGDLSDPYENLVCGARVLAGFLEYYQGDLYLGLSGYNAGHAMPDKARKARALPANVGYVEDVLWARAQYLAKGCEF